MLVHEATLSHVVFCALPRAFVEQYLLHCLTTPTQHISDVHQTLSLLVKLIDYCLYYSGWIHRKYSFFRICQNRMQIPRNHSMRAHFASTWHCLIFLFLCGHVELPV